MINSDLFWPVIIALFAGVAMGLTGSVWAVLGVVAFGSVMWAMERRDNERE